MKLLPAEEIQEMLRERGRWALVDGKLVRDWTFPDFVHAMAFVQQVAVLAEEANHHPDIDIRYNRVRLALISHDANGLTSRDRAMARKIDERFQEM